MNVQGSTLLGGRGTAALGSEKLGAVKRRSDRLRGGGRVGSVTTVGCSHSRQDAARGARARRQVDDDRLALDAAFAVLVAEPEPDKDAGTETEDFAGVLDLVYVDDVSVVLPDPLPSLFAHP